MAELSDGPVTRAETAMMVAICQTLANVATTPGLDRLDDLIRQQQRAEAIGPLINPTEWLGAFSNQDLGMKLLLAVHDFRKAMRGLKEDVEAIRGVEEAPGVPS